MKFNDFGSFIKYVRNHIIVQPCEECEGDDLTIEIYDTELSIRINSLYDGPLVIYNATTEKIENIFYKIKPDIYEDSGCIDEEQILVVAALIKLIKENKEMLNNFLGRKD